ncbi:MAG: MBL fold metallo-hydrolase [Thermoplasmata archaeon]|nr:MBL fold metallo-hydrolase [Thermoplasmata archaeon]
MRTAPTDLPHPYIRPERAGAVPLIGPAELKALLEGPEPPVVIDVRAPAERLLGHLPRDRSIPLAELPRHLDELPRDRPLVTYDQFGSDARRAVDYLRGRGFFLTAALEGGIDDYARIADPEIARYGADARDGTLWLRQFPRADTGCLAYLLGDRSAGKAVVIDPGRDPEPYLAALSEGGWDRVAIVETHTHADHLAGHSPLHAKTDAPIFLSRSSPALYPHRALAEADAIPFGSEEVAVLETPGHTKDHLTLRVRDKIFSGDTLLIGACGRTDLGDGNPELLYESLTEKLLRLPDTTEVYPAHFGRRHALVERYCSTVGFERATNEALNQGSRAAFLAYMTEGWPPKPAEFDRIVAENLRA